MFSLFFLLVVLVVFFIRQILASRFQIIIIFFHPQQSVKVPTNILTKGDIYRVSLKPFNVHLEQHRIRTFMEMAFLKQLPLI